MQINTSVAQLAIQGTRLNPELASTIGQWEYVCCECFVQISGGGVTAVFTYECAACGNTNLRFIHTLENTKDNRQIWVGLECARALMSDWETPRLAENEVKRKERWRIHYRKPGRCIVTVDELIEKGKL